MRVALADHDDAVGAPGGARQRRAAWAAAAPICAASPTTDRPRAECLAAAIRRGGFARALRAKVTLDPKLVESVGR